MFEVTAQMRDGTDDSSAKTMLIERRYPRMQASECREFRGELSDGCAICRQLRVSRYQSKQRAAFHFASRRCEQSLRDPRAADKAAAARCPIPRLRVCGFLLSAPGNARLPAALFPAALLGA